MAEKSFFERVFCKGEVNRLVTSEYDENVNQVLENLAKGNSSESAKDLIENSQSSNTNNFDNTKKSKKSNSKNKEFQNKVVDDNLGVVFNADIMTDNDDSGSFDFRNNGIDKNLGLQGSDSINTNKNVELYQAPVVSGLIFDDKDDNDDKGFVVKGKQPEVKGNIVEDDVANDLINMLSQKATETKPKYVEPTKKSKVVESEIDLPMI